MSTEFANRRLVPVKLQQCTAARGKYDSFNIWIDCGWQVKQC